MKALQGLLALVLALAGGTAAADVIVMELEVGGRLEIGPDGRVQSHELDAGLPEAIERAVGTAMAGWLFEPVLENGRPIVATTRMHLALEAFEQNPDALGLRVRHVWFGERLAPIAIQLPRYPKAALRRNVGAQVVLALRLDADGRVAEAHAQQTRFPPGTSEADRRRFAEMFEQSSVSAAREWNYGEAAFERLGATITTTVEFRTDDGGRRRKASPWKAWVVGPVTPPPWHGDAARPSATPPSLAEGVGWIADERIALLTEVAGRTL